MRLLLLETATDACSVALSVDGRLVQRYTTQQRAHAARVLEMVDECLHEAGAAPRDLDALAFGRGPGSFTGVRIAAGVVQGLAFGLSCPVVPLSTLAGFAATANRQHGADHVAVCIDARMGECYWGLYEVDPGGVVTCADVECLARPGDLPLPDSGEWLAVGSGWSAYPDLQSRMAARLTRAEPDVLPAAADLAPTAVMAFARGDCVPAAQALPVYLRERVAWQS